MARPLLPRLRTLALLGTSVAVAAAGLVVSGSSKAQHVAPGEPLTLVVGVGSPEGTSMAGLDGRRSNHSRVPLPTSSLRILWSRQTHSSPFPPVVTADGTVIALGSDGEADFLNADGTSQGHLQMGPGPMSAPVLLAGGTLVAVNGQGDVIGVRRREIVFRHHAADLGTLPDPDGFALAISRSGRHGGARRRQMGESGLGSRVSILPTDDGGLAIAFERELVSLDAEGNVRSRATSPVPFASSLLALTGSGSGSVAFVAADGAVYVWDLAAPIDAVRMVGTFGGSLDGHVAVVDGRHLVGVVHGTRVVSVDLVTGVAETRTTRAVGAQTAFTDAFALDATGEGVLLQEVTVSGTQVVTIPTAPDGGATGALFPILLSSLTTLGVSLVGDAGAAAAALPTGTALFSDPTGHVAYATAEGHVGVLSPTAKHELGSFPCGAPAPVVNNPYGQAVRRSSGIAGLVPAGAGGFLIACESGIVSLVRGGVD